MLNSTCQNFKHDIFYQFLVLRKHFRSLLVERNWTNKTIHSETGPLKETSKKVVIINMKAN